MNDIEIILTPISKKMVPYQADILASAKLVEVIENLEELTNDNTIGNVPDDDHKDVPKITLDTIGQFINPVGNIMVSRKDVFIRMNKLLMTTLEQIQGRTNRKHMMINLMTQFTGYLDIINEPAFAGYSIVIKGKFNEFIRRERVYELIPIYNIIYNDNVFANIETVPEVIITKADIDAYIKQYNDDLTTYANKNTALRSCPKYEKGEIIGAKNNEGNWYMAEVLEIFHHKHVNMYYVEFKGWGDHFNEFISNRFRLKRFNPRRHIYYRPAWKHHQPASVASNNLERISLDV